MELESCRRIVNGTGARHWKSDPEPSSGRNSPASHDNAMNVHKSLQHFFKSAAKCFQNLDAGKSFVVAGDDGPGRKFGAGMRDHIVDRSFVGAPSFAVAPVFIGDFVTFEDDFLALFEAA